MANATQLCNELKQYESDLYPNVGTYKSSIASCSDMILNVKNNYTQASGCVSSTINDDQGKVLIGWLDLLTTSSDIVTASFESQLTPMVTSLEQIHSGMGDNKIVVKIQELQKEVSNMKDPSFWEGAGKYL